MRILCCCLFLLILLYSCNSNDITESKDVTQEHIYQYYSVNHKEGEENVEVLVQFRVGGEAGATLVLNKPGKLKLDNNEMVVDSSTALGAYYRVFSPVKDFYGKHVFEYTDINNKVFTNEFDFQPFTLKLPPDSLLKGRPYQISFQSSPLKNEDRIELSASETDSVFKVVHTVKSGVPTIVLPEADILRQRGQFIRFEAALFRNIPLQANTGEGGQMEIRQVLKPFRMKLRD